MTSTRTPEENALILVLQLMAGGVSPSFAVENDSSSELSSLMDDSSEISKYNSVSDSSLSPRAEVTPYRFEPE